MTHIPLEVFEMLDRAPSPRAPWRRRRVPRKLPSGASGWAVSPGRTLREAIERLDDLGYNEQFVAEEGELATTSGERLRSEDICVDSIGRFEGSSSPDDQVLVVALRDVRTGTRGTYVVPFGPLMPAEDSRVVERVVALSPGASKSAQ